MRRIQLKRYGVSAPRLHKKTRLINSQYSLSMLSTYVVSMKITIRRYSKSSKLGMISKIYYERSAHSKESSPIRRTDTPYLPRWIKRIGCQNSNLQMSSFKLQNECVFANLHQNKRFDEEIKKIGFTQNPDEPCVYLKASGSNVAFLVLYVDDILLMQNSVAMLQEVKSWLCKCFSMKDLGESTYILGIKIIRDRSKRLISREILKKFIMENSKKGYTLMMEKPDYRKSQGAKTLLTYNICREFLMLRL
ncbi:retrotransposon protein, putative, ty1-copia subclass [Tanacetum coccineum]